MKTPSNEEVLSQRLDLLLARLDQDRSRVIEGGDPEALHDFRVTLRRLRTCLRLLEDRYPVRKLKPTLLFLKQIAKDTNTLRDQEVLCSTWHSLPPTAHPSRVWRQWLASQETLRTDQAKGTRERFASADLTRDFSALKKTLALADPQVDPSRTTEMAFQKEQRKLGKILKKIRGQKAGAPLLHKLRVQAKRTRYSLEEFDFLLPRQGRKMAAQCKKIQEVLGEWRDLDHAAEVLKKVDPLLTREARPWLRELKDRKDQAWRKYLQSLPLLRKTLK